MKTISIGLSLLAATFLLSCAGEDSSNEDTSTGGTSYGGPIGGVWQINKVSCNGVDRTTSLGQVKLILTLDGESGKSEYLYASPSTCLKTITHSQTYSGSTVTIKGLNDGQIACSGNCSPSECATQPHNPNAKQGTFSYARAGSNLSLTKTTESGDPACQAGETMVMDGALL